MKGPIHCFASDLLAGKLAMVTGGGTGIGRAIAAELARSGADLILAARRLDVLETAAEEIRIDTKRRVHCRQVDIRNLETVDALVDSIDSEFGQVDILVNNAGGQFLRLLNVFHLVVGVLSSILISTWNMTQAIGKQMLVEGTICQITIPVGRGNQD